MSSSTTTVTNLEHITIHSTTRTGHTRYDIYLKANRLKVVTIWCKSTAVTKLWIDEDFQDYEQERIEQVFHEFYKWKRVANPHKLKRFSGRTKTGETHPWRKKPKHPVRPMEKTTRSGQFGDFPPLGPDLSSGQSDQSDPSEIDTNSNG